MSRLKKKLLIYFLLISIVSVSVSAEIILEVSSIKLKNSISSRFLSQLDGKISPGDLSEIKREIDYKYIYEPVQNFRNRMILFLLVVTISIIGAFFMFAKDIVSPMDGIVRATRKIADGDLTVTVPVMSHDEIGQLAGLINDMNVNLQDLIFQVKQEVNRYKNNISMIHNKILVLIESDSANSAIERKKMRLSEFKDIINTYNEIIGFFHVMSNDLSSLQTYVGVYKTYRMPSEISQDEIEKAIRDFSMAKA